MIRQFTWEGAPLVSWWLIQFLGMGSLGALVSWWFIVFSCDQSTRDAVRRQQSTKPTSAGGHEKQRA